MFNYGTALWFICSATLFASSVCCHQTQITSLNITETNATSKAQELPCTKLEPNDYLDGLINSLKNKTIDTIPLPDDPGITNLKEGQVWGLSTLARSGNATVKCNETFTSVETLLKFEELKARYKWEKKVIFETFSGFIFVEADTADILFRVSQERGNDTGMTLEELSIKNLSGIHTNMTGFGIATWVVNVITEPAANLFKKSLARMVEGPLKEAIGMALRDINVPLY